MFSFDESVAILDFEAINLRESDVNALTQRLNSEIINLNKFIVLERHSIKQIVEEQNFQYSGLIDVNTISDIGAMIGANYVIVGSISKIGGQYLSVDSRIIEVKSSKSIKSANYDANDLGQLLKEGMQNIAYQLCEIKIPQGNNTIQKNIKQIPSNNNQYQPTKTLDSKRESWYYYVSYAVLTSHGYPQVLEDYIIDVDEIIDERTEGSIELVGIYFHVKPKIIAGLIYDYSNDNISYDYSYYDLDFRSLNLTHTFLGLSLIGYFTEFGNGGFYKFDIGRAALDYNFSVIADDDTNISKNGTGFGIGIGYSFYLEQFNKTRAFISYNLSIRNIDLTNTTVPILEDFESYNKSCINFGFIF